MELNKLEFLTHLVTKFETSVFPVYAMNKKTGFCSCRQGAKCSAPGKHPVIYDKVKGKSWKDQASRDLVLVQKWVEKGYNFGTPCGFRKHHGKGYLVVIDIDVNDHELLPRFKESETFGYRTGRGGYHFWFLSKTKVKNSVSHIALNIDVRGEGGYVVIPPSNHHSGGDYSLFEGWASKAIQPAPGWLLEMLAGNEVEFQEPTEPTDKPVGWKVTGKIKRDEDILAAEGAIRGWRKGDATVEELRERVIKHGLRAPFGTRHDLVFRLASSDRGKGEILTYAQVAERVKSYNTQNWLVEPMEEEEVKKIILSIMKFKVFNTDYRKVNSSYVRWSLLHDKTWDMPKDWADQLDKLDDEFFGEIRLSMVARKLEDTSFKGIPLAEIQQKRNEWYAHRGVVKHARFSPRLFAKKLESVGFQSHRYTRGIVWKALEGWSKEAQAALETLRDVVSDEIVKETSAKSEKDQQIPLSVDIVKNEVTGFREVRKVAGGPRKKTSKGGVRKTASNAPKHKRYRVPVSETDIMLASVRFITEVIDPWVFCQSLKPRLEMMPKKKIKFKKDQEQQDDTPVLNRF
jgi:hypothetical protein